MGAQLPVKKPYTKQHTQFQDQVKLLQSRGIIVNDPARAEFVLRHVNYYRLTAYWLPFETDHANHTFRSGTTFEKIHNLYSFDEALRRLVLEGISLIEISLRCQWSYVLSRQHGPHAHLDQSLAQNKVHLQSNLQTLKKEIDRSNEIFITHFKTVYLEPFPPIWASSEIMSFGLLSRFYDNLKPMPLRKEIAAVYRLNDTVLESWIRHLTSLRNYAAHQARLWNRDFTITPVIPRTNTVPTKILFDPSTRRIYNGLLIIITMLDVIRPGNDWKKRLLTLIVSHRINPVAMGFPAGWELLSFWKK